jgi:hypothetical protein
LKDSMNALTGVVSSKGALFIEHHRRHRRDRFRHRVDAKDGVGFYRKSRLFVALSVDRQVSDAAVPADENQPAGQAAVVDVAAEMAVDPLQARGVETQLFGIGHFERGGCFERLHNAITVASPARRFRRQ